MGSWCKNVVVVEVRKWEIPFGECSTARECALICLHVSIPS